MKKIVLNFCGLVVLMLAFLPSRAQEADPLLAPTPQYTVVKIYLKESDSTVVAKPLKFEADIANPGWVQFLTDFRAYFFTGQAQPLSRYQVQAIVNGVNQNTHLNVRFSDIALVHINTVGYGLVPGCNAAIRDQSCTLLFKKSGQADPFIGTYNKGLSDMVLYFEPKYLSGNVSGKKEYVVKPECMKMANQLLIDWKYIRGIQLSTNPIN